MDAAKIVSKISKEHGIIKNVYFLACGGSLVDLYPGYYFVRAESAVMDAQWIPAREFALTPPKKLGKNSLLMIIDIHHIISEAQELCTVFAHPFSSFCVIIKIL